MTRKKTPKAAPLPPLPDTVFTTCGPVAVKIVDDLRDPEDPDCHLFGYWNAFDRVICIRAGMHPTAMHLTLWHERTHCDLSEIGVKLSDDQEEAVCNAVANARVAELLATLSPV